MDTAALTPRGGLQADRMLAFVDARGRFVNGKSNARVHALGATYDGDFRTVTLHDRASDERRTFALDDQLDELARWTGVRPDSRRRAACGEAANATDRRSRSSGDGNQKREKLDLGFFR